MPAGRRTAVRWLLAVMGGSHRRGRFRLHSAVTVVAIMGGDDIDLRDAELDGGQATLNVISIMGGPIPGRKGSSPREVRRRRSPLMVRLRRIAPQAAKELN
jgi:hypothetical protein